MIAAIAMVAHNLHSYLVEKRRALEAWEGLLLEVVGERVRPPNVRELRGSGA
jgi:hypothetical protein